jgi:hypothetical protein
VFLKGKIKHPIAAMRKWAAAKFSFWPYVGARCSPARAGISAMVEDSSIQRIVRLTPRQQIGNPQSEMSQSKAQWHSSTTTALPSTGR